MSECPTAADATDLLRRAEASLDQGDRSAARFGLALLENSQNLGAIFAAQILSERLRAPGARQNRPANLTRAA